MQVPVVQGTSSESTLDSGDEATSADPGGMVLLGATEDRVQAAEQQAAAANVELQPVTRTPQIEVPVMEVHARPIEFSLKQVTDEAPFRELGHRLAVDPDYTLKRTRLDALVSADAITGTRETSWRQAAALDKIAAAEIVEDPETAHEMVLRSVVASRYVPSRKGEPYQASRLLDAVLAGAGKKAGGILSSYRDRLVRGMLQLIVEAQRALPPSAHTTVMVRREPFAPRPRMSRAHTTADRYAPRPTRAGSRSHRPACSPSPP